jgi:hypoxanthine-guanine phosphoribosyltransferase
MKLHSPIINEKSLISIDKAVSSVFCNSSSPISRNGDLDFHVMPFGKGQVVLSVIIPDGMIKPTSDLLESLHGIFKFTDIKKRNYQAQEKVHDLDEIQKRNDYRDDMTSKVIQIFDDLLASGLTMRQAISETNKTLKLNGTAFLTVYQVELILREAGKLRKAKAIV